MPVAPYVPASSESNDDPNHVSDVLRARLQAAGPRAHLAPTDTLLSLPDPVFPHFPEKAGDVEPPAKYLPQPGHNYRTRVGKEAILKAFRGWLYPYVKSRTLPGEFHPIISYLFTEWKCNLDCHYCYSFDNRIKGMSEDTARRAIDWLETTTCRVLALMGGEVLLRPAFAHKVIDYAAQKGFWVYLPTNGRLMRPEVIDRVGDAGVATVNLAVDVVEEQEGLPKALAPIRPYFDYLLKKQYVYDFSVFFNINITRVNLEDVKRLTEIAHDCGIATDYHINEAPYLEQEHFHHASLNRTHIRKEDWPAVDEVVDWLIEKNKAGYKMVNSVSRLQEMKAFMRDQVEPWDCRAGMNSIVIRTDGTLAPCFPFYSATEDWGVVGHPKFVVPDLDQMKVTCQKHCFSTLNHNLAYCYKASRAIKWVLKQAAHGFQGSTGSFDD
mgnify:CR=1 FL=1